MSGWERKSSIHPAADAALAFLASGAFFLLAALAAPARDHLVLILALGAAYACVVFAAAKWGGPLYAVPLAIAGGLALDSFYVSPVREFGTDSWQNWLVNAVYIAVGVLIGMLGERSQRRADTFDQARGLLAEEQAALQRVATLVARGDKPDAIFAAVAEEVGVLLDVDGARVVYFLSDDEILQLDGWTTPGHPPLPGGPLKFEGSPTPGEVLRTGRTIRIDDYESDDIVVPSIVRDLGIQSAVVAPIVVDGRLWGAMLAWSLQPRTLADDIASRLAAFTELVGMAISNTASQEQLARLADEQAALRRVATLVARAVAPAEVFDAVASELGQLLGVDATHVARYQPDGIVEGVGGWSTAGSHAGVGTRLPLEDSTVTALVLKSGRPGRIDSYEGASDKVAAVTQEIGIRSSVGAPIVVDGDIWGVMIASTSVPQPLPPDTESRISAFSDLVATAISNTEARAETARLADEQAALRRVATLVARGVPPTEVFAAVVYELGRLLGVDATHMERYEPDGTAAIGVGGWSMEGTHLAVGKQIPLDDTSVAGLVFATGRPARIHSYEGATHDIAAVAREIGITSSVGAPIVVDGRLWGVMVASSSHPEPLPADTESRIAAFTELVATAISNTEARAETSRLADEQAALRRVATLVAEGAAPASLLALVAEEVARIMHVWSVSITRYEADGTATELASFSEGSELFPVGKRWSLDGKNVLGDVRETREPARINDHTGLEGEIAETVRGLGICSTVGIPIVVAGRLWGAMVVSSRESEPLAERTEAHLTDFTELLATAIANAEGRAELDASRARIVATADATRRQIERNLHDGAQQQLVSLALELRAAQAAVPAEHQEPRAELARAVEGLKSVLEELRKIARGIHPAVLAEGGLRPALKALARRSAVPVELDLPAGLRLSERVEVAAYYVVSEALTNAAKHARASLVHVAVEVRGPMLQVYVRDDGDGGADPARGSGLLGLKDRVEAIGGTMRLQSLPGEGTSLEVDLPLHDPAGETRAAASGPVTAGR